jgi:hypothetical protein
MQAMRNSYLILDEYMRFLDNTGRYQAYVLFIVELDIPYRCNMFSGQVKLVLLTLLGPERRETYCREELLREY